jgi:hypothetical protein
MATSVSSRFTDPMAVVVLVAWDNIILTGGGSVLLH